MAKKKTEDNKPKVSFNSDGSVTVSGAKSWAEASKAVKSSINQSREKADAVRGGTAYKNAVLNRSVNSGSSKEKGSTKQDAKKTAVDRLWDRGSTTPKKSASDEARSEVVKVRRNTEQKQKELEDYQNSELDWTNSAARQLYEQGEKQKKQEIAKAQAEQNAAVANFDRVQMNAMPEEDRELIDEYIRREDTASDPLATGTDAIVEQFVNQNSGVDEKRLNLIKVSNGGGAKSLIMNILRQAGIEATEEELSLIGTTLADAAIMQEKSEYNQTVLELMAQGMTEEQAREQANWGLVQEAAETAIVSGIAGGIGGFGAAKANAYMNGDLDKAIQMTLGMETAEDTAQKAAQQPQTAQNPQDVNVDVQKETAAQATQEVQKQQTPQEQEQAILKAIEETPAENAPKTEPVVKTDGQKLMEQGVQKTLGTEPVADTEKAESSQQTDTPEVSVQDGQAENAESRPVESAQPAATANAEQTKGMQNAPSGDIGKSRTFTNTGIRSADEDIRKSYRETMKENPSAADYDVKHNADTKATAEQRTETLEKANAEYEYLMGAGNWTAEDNVTAELAIKMMLREGGDESAWKIADLKQKRKAVNKDAGELIQSNRIIGTMKSAVDTYTALDTFYTGIDKISEGDSTFKSKKGSSFENWKNGIKEQATRIAIAIEMVDDNGLFCVLRKESVPHVLQQVGL